MLRCYAALLRRVVTPRCYAVLLFRVVMSSYLGRFVISSCYAALLRRVVTPFCHFERSREILRPRGSAS